MATKSTIVLCEDETQWLFVYRWLLKRGLRQDELHLISLPAGRGAGTQHVLQKYVTEVRAYRAKANSVASRRLVVVIDGDTSTVGDRLEKFDELLGSEPRANNERICILVPRRNMETWVHYFYGNGVNESTDYKPQYQGDDKRKACKIGGEAFEQWLRSSPLPGAPESLVASRVEAERL